MPDPSSRAMALTSKLFARHGALGIFSLRHGGVSDPPFDSLNLGYGLGDTDAHVETNIRRFLDAFGLPRPHTAHQCHGTTILNCDGPARAHDANADILMTRDHDTAVGVRIADCVPILLADPQRRTLAAVHAGWRGTALRAVERAVRAMQSNGSNPSDLLAAIGPAIGRCCYVIGDDTAEQLGYPGLSEAFVRIDGHLHADLALLNFRQLTGRGVPEDSIEHFAACTSCQSDHFFSHRREHGCTGRHLAVAAWSTAP